MAGFFDGEGNVNWAITNKGYSTLTIGVTNLSRRVLELFEDAFGGKISHRSDNVFQWQVCGEESVVAAKALLPFCLIKKKQLKLYIEGKEICQIGVKFNGRGLKDSRLVDLEVKYSNRIKKAKKDTL